MHKHISVLRIYSRREEYTHMYFIRIQYTYIYIYLTWVSHALENLCGTTSVHYVLVIYRV